MPRQRLGVALLVPGGAAYEIDGLRRALGDGSLDRIPPHLTLVPPVNVREPDVVGALSLLRTAAGETPPLRLRLGPAATFHPATPVVYLRVDGDVDELRSLRNRLFRAPLARALTHPFVPHVTLADDIAPERIPAALAALADFNAEVVIDRVHLLREEPGRVWRPIADAAFAEPAIVGRGGLPVELTVSDQPGPDAEPLLATSHTASGAAVQAFTVTARREGEVVGAAQGWTRGSFGRLLALVVAEEARRQGIARHLVAAVEDLARRRGVHTLHAEAADSPACAGLLESAGWLASGSALDGWRSWRRTLAGSTD